MPNIVYNHRNAVLAFGNATMVAGWTTKGFAVHWANHFKLHKQPDQRYPPVLSELIFCCWPDVAIQATTIHSTDPDEEEPDQQITYPKCTDGVMLKDVCLQLVQPDMIHTMDLGVAAIRASMASSGSDDPDRLWVWWRNDHQGPALELAQELAPSPDVGLQEPAQELEVVVPMCEDWDDGCYSRTSIQFIQCMDL